MGNYFYYSYYWVACNCQIKHDVWVSFCVVFHDTFQHYEGDPATSMRVDGRRRDPITSIASSSL